MRRALHSVSSHADSCKSVQCRPISTHGGQSDQEVQSPGLMSCRSLCVSQDEAVENSSSEASELEVVLCDVPWDSVRLEVVLRGVPWDSAWICLRKPRFFRIVSAVCEPMCCLLNSQWAASSCC